MAKLRTTIAATALLLAAVGVAAAQSTPSNGKAEMHCLALMTNDLGYPFETKFFTCPEKPQFVTWPSRPWLQPSPPKINHSPAQQKKANPPLDLSAFRR
jgi:hypothetical protein